MNRQQLLKYRLIAKYRQRVAYGFTAFQLFWVIQALLESDYSNALIVAIPIVIYVAIIELLERKIIGYDKLLEDLK